MAAIALGQGQKSANKGLMKPAVQNLRLSRLVGVQEGFTDFNFGLSARRLPTFVGLRRILRNFLWQQDDLLRYIRNGRGYGRGIGPRPG